MRRFGLGLMVAACLLLALPAGAKDAYYSVKIGDLKFSEGELPPENAAFSAPWRLSYLYLPVVVLEGGGEGYVAEELRTWRWGMDLREMGTIVAKAPAGQPVRGELRLHRTEDDGAGQVRLRFEIPPSAAGDFRDAFATARDKYYSGLIDRRVPGTTWFRYQRDRGKDPGSKLDITPDQWRRRRMNDLSSSYRLFSGATALGENLQLDRPLVPRGGSEKLVALDTVEGITVEEIDWAPLMPEGEAKLDALSAYVPYDQHALFFPSFEAMTTLVDEADGIGTPLLTIFETHSEDADVKGRYQRQLALSMSHLARLLGPKLVRSVAFTGSDPFMRLGTDVAVLFDAGNPGLLVQHIRSKQAAAKAATPGTEAKSGEVDGLQYEGVCSPDRQVCSFLATSGDVVVVTNSLAQLGRIAKTLSGQLKGLKSLPEYQFFRHRYSLGEGLESALLMLPDAAIRRWCGPRWRIADSRRIRAASVLAYYQAKYMRELQAGQAPRIDKSAIGPLEPTASGYLSATYGSLNQMTPILEMAIDEVTEEEVEAYGWFRTRYQQNWRNYFDPVAIRFYLDEDEITLDVSVMPLIAGSEYRELIELTRGKRLQPETGDPHDGILVRYGMSLNPDSDLVRQASTFAVSIIPGLKSTALTWLGDSLVVYADDDKFWREWWQSPDKDKFFMNNIHRFPAAIRIAVASPLKATAFLASMRAFIEQTAPGMTAWETREQGELAYVRVGSAKRWDRSLPEELAIYYAMTGDALTITLNEDLLKRSLSREAKRAATEGAAGHSGGDAWVGDHVAIQATGRLLKLVDLLMRDEFVPEIQGRAWDNIPILNEWKRLFPAEDPVQVHQRLWQVKLLCPGGGEYVWNDEWQTMESTIYGHPGAPRKGPTLLRKPLSDFTFGNFGLTFDNDGLRARGTLYKSDLKRGGWAARILWKLLRGFPAEARERLKLAGEIGYNLVVAFSSNRLH